MGGLKSKVFGSNRGGDEAIWLTECDCWQGTAREKTNQMFNQLQCTIHELVFEPCHSALSSKYSLSDV